MPQLANAGPGSSAPRRLTKDARRRQLLDTARAIVRDEGADRLTLGRLASRAGVSKPIAYDHFGARSGLLIDLYRWIDTEKVEAFQKAMALGEHTLDDTVELLAAAYIDCAADTAGESHAVGAALAGSQEKAAVFQELLDASVQMFVAVLRPHCTASQPELERRCIGLVGAGEALAAATVRKVCSQAEAVEEFARLISGALAPGTRQRPTS